MNSIINMFASLKLTVLLLALLSVLVFVATLDQVNLGIYFMIQKYFSGVFVWWPINEKVSIPVFPSGLSIGIVLFINLLVAHFTRFVWKPKKVGLWLLHFGLLLLIFGSAMTKFFAEESQIILKEQTSKNYTEHQRKMELVFIEKSGADDKVTVIPSSLLQQGNVIETDLLPFSIKVNKRYENAEISMNPVLQEKMKGLGRRLAVREVPVVTQDNVRNALTIQLDIESKGSYTKWWVSNVLGWHQEVTFNNKSFWMLLRPKRDYLEIALYLEDFSHDVYPGTTIPKNFSSDVLIKNKNDEIIESVHIYMNHPLRYEGRTFYQASYAENNTVSILQVVKNPGWLFPYLSTLIMAIGLTIYFIIHLFSYLKRGSK